MKSAVTVCCVSEMAAGPFVFHGDLAGAVRTAADLGFDAVEVFAGSAAELRALDLPGVLAGTGLAVAAVGTGAGWVKHKLTLTDPDPAGRQKAAEYVRDFIDAAADLGAMVIVGSMQGRRQPGEPAGAAYARLVDALGGLGRYAAGRGTTVLFEPLNRYEGDILNTVAAASELVTDAGVTGLAVLADLFHMNIEDVSIEGTLRHAGGTVNHVHLADSNRRAAGRGHTDLAAAVGALKETGYAGYLSAEVFPDPDGPTAAAQAIAAFRRLVAGGPA